jgi:hypothetical protein
MKIVEGKAMERKNFKVPLHPPHLDMDHGIT